MEEYIVEEMIADLTNKMIICEEKTHYKSDELDISFLNGMAKGLEIAINLIKSNSAK